MKEKEAKSKGKKPIFKKWWFWVLIVIILFSAFGGTGNKETHIYDKAQVKNVMNGIHTKKLGEYSIIKISSEEVTDEALADWYFNYVDVNDFNWCMILYTDKNDNSGVYAIKGMVIKDLQFEKDEYGDYSTGDSSNATMYAPADDNTLQVVEFEQ